MLALIHGNKLQHFIEAFNKISFLIKRYIIMLHDSKDILKDIQSLQLI